jgi:hypothetical protein
MNDKEKEKLSQYNLRRDRMVADREAAKAAEKTVKDKITKLVDEEAKDDLEGYYHAIQCHWKNQGIRSKAAYHGGSWNGKDAREVMSDVQDVEEVQAIANSQTRDQEIGG